MAKLVVSLFFAAVGYFKELRRYILRNRDYSAALVRYRYLHQRLRPATGRCNVAYQGYSAAYQGLSDVTGSLADVTRHYSAVARRYSDAIRGYSVALLRLTEGRKPYRYLMKKR